MFFDPTSSAHMALIKPAHQQFLAGKHKDLLAFVEQDILFEYTKRDKSLGNTTTTPIADREYYSDGTTAIMLRGYDPNPELCDTLLRFALVSTIASVVNHRLFQMNVNSVQDSTNATGGGGSTSVTYRDDAFTRFPEGWDAMLSRFDTRSVGKGSPIIVAWG